MGRMVKWNTGPTCKYEMKYVIQTEICGVWDNAAIAYFLMHLVWNKQS